jgi:hypothetical protein
LPYGTGTDWLRNVQKAGRATITVHGQTFNVMRPSIIDAADADRQLSPRRSRAFRRFGVKNFLKFETVRPAPGDRTKALN